MTQSLRRGGLDFVSKPLQLQIYCWKLLLCWSGQDSRTRGNDGSRSASSSVASSSNAPRNRLSLARERSSGCSSRSQANASRFHSHSFRLGSSSTDLQRSESYSSRTSSSQSLHGGAVQRTGFSRDDNRSRSPPTSRGGVARELNSLFNWTAPAAGYSHRGKRKGSHRCSGRPFQRKPKSQRGRTRGSV